MKNKIQTKEEKKNDAHDNHEKTFNTTPSKNKLVAILALTTQTTKIQANLPLSARHGRENDRPLLSGLAEHPLNRGLGGLDFTLKPGKTNSKTITIYEKHRNYNTLITNPHKLHFQHHYFPIQFQSRPKPYRINNELL
jgi:hypothetical protein